ncbi:MAG: hypothetical protein EA382_17795, partial [Spirochaetaceae bacterium]
PESIDPTSADGERIVRALSLATDSGGPATLAALRARAEQAAREAGAQEQSLQPPAVFVDLKPRIDGYFELCRAARSIADAPDATRFDDLVRAALDTFDPGVVASTLATLPIARPSRDLVLPLTDRVNPAYESALERFAAEVVTPTLGATNRLTEADWRQVVDQFTAPPPTGGAASDIADLRSAIRLALFQQNLLRFANSFVSCPDLYHADRRAAFEAGTLYVGGYAMTFAVKVANRQFHAETARTSNIFVVYASVYRDAPPAYEVAVPVTNGTGRRLFRGKQGMFVDTVGREWNAEIVDIVVNPIGLMEAVGRPFRRLGEMVTGRIDAVTRDAEAAIDARAASVLSGTPAPAPPASQPGSPKAGPLAGFGSVATAGLLVAAVTSAIAFVTSTLSGVPWWHIAIGVGAAIVAVALPAIVSALFKLARRDLSIILEGARWAMNSPLRLSRRQARFFTRKAPRRRHRPRRPDKTS